MGRKAHGKNGPKPIGRPRKGFRRNGSGLKKSAGLERITMDAGCRLYDMVLQEVLVHYPARGECACGATEWSV